MTAWPELLGAPDEVAPRLLGATLRHGAVVVRITEVEAYGGADDPGSHAYRGRTPRTGVMFGPAGRLYCYLSYGMHVCANVALGEEGVAGAVLVRAGEVVDGLDVARARRPGSSDQDLARGPARLTRALAISLDHDGADLASGAVTLELGAPVDDVAAGPRTGLRLAADRPWRFWMPGERSVSPYRKHPRATAHHPDL
ncbi:DNA-3-methyladenine glycosylase [Nocardioides sp. C4-1]|uniref:DNA-3-methyladenine glycosylase n=1 Tax=Nocardioides sp. C4-1 TaxID=3151851 RepID=UPI003262F7BE